MCQYRSKIIYIQVVTVAMATENYGVNKRKLVITNFARKCFFADNKQSHPKPAASLISNLLIFPNYLAYLHIR